MSMLIKTLVLLILHLAIMKKVAYSFMNSMNPNLKSVKRFNHKLQCNKSFSNKYKKSDSSATTPITTNIDIIEQPNQYDLKRIQFQNKLGLSLDDPRFIIKPTTTGTVAINNKKMTLIDKSLKTGAELRRDRKQEEINKTNSKKLQSQNQKLKNQLHRTGGGASSSATSSKTNNNSPSTASASNSRFVLGNGVEGLTVDSLLNLVRSTAPYYFPAESQERDVIDEEEFLLLTENEAEYRQFYTANSQTSSRGKATTILPPIQTSSSSKATKATDIDVEEDVVCETPWEQIFHDSRRRQLILSSSRESSSNPNANSIGISSSTSNLNHINSNNNNNKPTEEERIQYFKLCIASHFATVATYVPTDVDSKIRGHCWYDPSPHVVEQQWLFFKEVILGSVTGTSSTSTTSDDDTDVVMKDKWDVAEVSTRVVYINGDAISGHNGEWLGTLIGAWGAMLRLAYTHDKQQLQQQQQQQQLQQQNSDSSNNNNHNNNHHNTRSTPTSTTTNSTSTNTNKYRDYANEIEEIIHAELTREAKYFQKLIQSKPSVQSDTILLKTAAIICHNLGDCDQGLSYWHNDTMTAEMKLLHSKYSRLAHERYERYDGVFAKAKIVYSKLLAAEGHRNYPLREAKCLRQHPDLLLPLSPWLESWGRTVASHEELTYQDKLLVLRQLLRGCDSQSRAWCVPNQVGYYRAIYGFASGTTAEASMDRYLKDLDKDCRRVYKEHDVRLHLSLSEEAFASKLGTQARELLVNFNANSANTGAAAATVNSNE